MPRGYCGSIGFIAKYNERARPVRWAYTDPSRRIA